MNIVWLSWKDRKHPRAGGAETVSGEIMDRLVRDGHKVKLLTSDYADSESNTLPLGIDIIRRGNQFTVYHQAKMSFKRALLDDWADIIIDEMNTLPFGSAFYSSTKNVLLNYQLAREVWLYQMQFPFSFVGYLSEPPMLRVLARYYKTTATESQSTKKDLEKYGFKNVNVFRVGIALQPLEKLSGKTRSNTVLYLGSIRPMKRVLHAVKSFECAKDKNTLLTMVIAGDDSGAYAKKVKRYIDASRYKKDITVLGRVTAEQRLNLMREAQVIVVTSIKEGWGLIVTEAASQGTPAVVYDTDGLRDSVKNGDTGILCPNGSPRIMGERIASITTDPVTYEKLRQNAWQESLGYTFENSYRDFLEILKK